MTQFVQKCLLQEAATLNEEALRHYSSGREREALDNCTKAIGLFLCFERSRLNCVNRADKENWNRDNREEQQREKGGTISSAHCCSNTAAGLTLSGIETAVSLWELDPRIKVDRKREDLYAIALSHNTALILCHLGELDKADELLQLAGSLCWYATRSYQCGNDVGHQ
jgi:tetratricopeptide (TPR) repeat protein